MSEDGAALVEPGVQDSMSSSVSDDGVVSGVASSAPTTSTGGARLFRGESKRLASWSSLESRIMTSSETSIGSRSGVPRAMVDRERFTPLWAAASRSLWDSQSRILLTKPSPFSATLFWSSVRALRRI